MLKYRCGWDWQWFGWDRMLWFAVALDWRCKCAYLVVFGVFVSYGRQLDTSALDNATTVETGSKKRLSEISKRTVDKCPRCHACKGSSHHWLADPDPELRWEYVCKHCPAKGDGCSECGTDGCSDCDGEGVIKVEVTEPTEA